MQFSSKNRSLLDYHRSFIIEPNRTKICQNGENIIPYKMAISDFQNFGILTPKT